jgi:hypothetical protein
MPQHLAMLLFFFFCRSTCARRRELGSKHIIAMQRSSPERAYRERERERERPTRIIG